MTPPDRGQGRTISLAAALRRFQEHWSPKVVAEYNGEQLKLVKFAGEFVWHRHAETDEVFLVICGEMQIEFRDRAETLHAGELLIVPRNVEHRTRAAGECHVLLIERRGTVNTGDAGGDLTPGNDIWLQQAADGREA